MPADVVIDGHGLYAAPGFIDTHSHSDLCVLTQPELRPKVMQGITTEALGQDGISMAPLPEPYISSWRKNLAGLDGDSDAIDWHYHTTAAYLSAIERAKPAINEAYLVPHGNVRMEAMGLADKPASPAEIKRMQEILRRELEAGAYGLSTGLIYIPVPMREQRNSLSFAEWWLSMMVFLSSISAVRRIRSWNPCRKSCA